MLLVLELSQYKIYLPDFDDIDSCINEFNDSIAKIPLDYKIHRSIFKEATNTQSSILSREIKRTITGLLSKVMVMPHPIEKDDSKSLTGITFFTEISYSNKSGYIDIFINKKAIEKLVAFAKYTKIKFSYIARIQNSYAIYTYLFLKILIDTSRGNKNLLIKLSEFKERLGLSKKYAKIAHFKEYVLEVIKKEINEYTDLNFNYELIKEGRSFNKIQFTFDYKPESSEQKTKSKSNKAKQLNVIESTCIDNYDSPFEQTLIGWNIRARKVVELEETYSLDVIQQAIDLTLEKEKAGEIKTTKAAIFLGILENKQLASDEQFERAKKDLENQQDKKLREKISAEYDKLSSFILSNQDIIQSALTANTKQLPTTDKDAIPIFKKLKSINADKFRAYTVPILNFYHFESNLNVSSILSDIVDRSHYIEIEEYKDDMEVVQAYKKAFGKIKENEYLSGQQKEVLKKEVLESINILLGF